VPGGLDGLIDEEGRNLSAAHRQLVAIARAWLLDPDVLVLDEATSSLDGATEQGVMDAVAALQGAKTIVIVAHRLSTVRRCDRLYRLERGRVAATGAFDAVVNQT
jgi:ABC-type multidrug transport system fused ATPase/permease subunit